MITHSELITIAVKLGYPHHLGLCDGFTDRFVESVCLDKEAVNQFNKRLLLLSKFKDNPDLLRYKIKEAKTKVRDGLELTQDDNDLIDVCAFYDSLYLSHLPHKYPEIFAKDLEQKDKKDIYPLTSSIRLQQKGPIECYLQKDYILNIDELEKFLHGLSFCLEKHPDAAVKLMKIGHSTSILLNPVTKKWHWLDINGLKHLLKIDPNETQSFSMIEHTSKEMAELIFKGFRDDKNGYTFFRTQIIAVAGNKALVRRVSFLKEPEIYEDHITRIESKGYGLFYRMILDKDFTGMRKLLKYDATTLQQLDAFGKSLFYKACIHIDDEEIMSELCDHQTATKIDRHLWEALKNRKLRNDQQAIEHLTKALELDGKNPYLYFERAKTYYFMRQDQKAYLDMQEAINIKADCDEFYVFFSKISSLLGYHEEAVKYLSEATKIDPKNMEAWIGLAAEYERIDQYEQALETYAEIVRLGNCSAKICVKMADVYNKIGDYNSAISYLTEAIELNHDLNPDLSEYAYKKRGDVYLEKAFASQRSQEFLSYASLAINDFSKLIQIKPNNKYSYINRAKGYLEIGEFEKALQDFEKAISLESDDLFNISISTIERTSEYRQAKSLTDMKKQVARELLEQNNAKLVFYCPLIEKEVYKILVDFDDKKLEINIQELISKIYQHTNYTGAPASRFCAAFFGKLKKVPSSITISLEKLKTVLEEKPSTLVYS